MPEFKIFKSDAKAAAGLGCLSFTVDGVESMKWFHPCTTGLGENYYVERCIGRLKAGKTDAFGGPVLVADGKSLRLRKAPVRASVREVAPRQWRYTLDGAECPTDYPNEAAARAACAAAAFMTRGKLGRLEEAEKEFQVRHGKKCRVVVKDNSIVAESECGARFAVGIADKIVFKPLEK